MLDKKSLMHQRNMLDKHRAQGFPQLKTQQLNESISASWQRSHSANISENLNSAPINSKFTVSKHLQRALQQCQSELEDIAQQSSMVVAVGDLGSTIIWSAARGSMQRAAEKVHFVEGGQWREDVVGTNALALSLTTQRSSCVFSNEHFMACIQDWVCYAAPIFDPISKQMLGVVDLSTTWDKHNSLGILAAERCAAMIEESLAHCLRDQIYIQALGQAQVGLNQKKIHLTPRQIEILCILALCPQGLSLDALHQAVYGERSISLGTLKAEISQLRELLGDRLVSRPYRLICELDADFLQVEKALDAGYITTALNLWTGIFLAKSESPFLCAWRDCIESRLSQAIYETQQTDLLFKHLSRCPEASDAVERLLELIPTTHPSHSMLRHYV